MQRRPALRFGMCIRWWSAAQRRNRSRARARCSCTARTGAGPRAAWAWQRGPCRGRPCRHWSGRRSAFAIIDGRARRTAPWKGRQRQFHCRGCGCRRFAPLAAAPPAFIATAATAGAISIAMDAGTQGLGGRALRFGNCLGRCFAWWQGNPCLAHRSLAVAGWQGSGNAIGCKQQALAGRQRRPWSYWGAAAAGLLLACRLAPLRPLVLLLQAGSRFLAARLRQVGKAGAAHGTGSSAASARQSPKVTLTLAGSVASMVTMRGMMRAGGGTGLSVVRSRLEPSAE